MDNLKDYKATKHSLEELAVSPLANTADMAEAVNSFAKRHPARAKEIEFKPFTSFNDLPVDLVIRSFNAFAN